MFNEQDWMQWRSHLQRGAVRGALARKVSAIGGAIFVAAVVGWLLAADRGSAQSVGMAALWGGIAAWVLSIFVCRMVEQAHRRTLVPRVRTGAREVLAPLTDRQVADLVLGGTVVAATGIFSAAIDGEVVTLQRHEFEADAFAGLPGSIPVFNEFGSGTGA
jgi:hypothetical protein